MPVTLTNVEPGDLITSEKWNLLLARVAELAAQVQGLSGNVSTGTVTVPNLFGLTLNQATAIITNPAQQLALGNVIDALGQFIDPNEPDAGSLLVINQIPSAGTKTFPGAGVSLLVAGTAGDGEPPPPTLPLISEVFPTPSPVGNQVEIRGSNFAPLNTNNVVTFDNIPTPNPPTMQSDVGTLFVTIPTGIPGAPTAQGQANKTGVVVRVRDIVRNVEAEFSGCVVAPPPAVPLPTITAVAPNPAFIGAILQVTGQNFSATAANNTVRFDNNPALQVVASSATAVAGGAIRLNVTIPTGISGLTQVGNDRSDVAIGVFRTGQAVPNPLQTFPARIRNAG